jgi:hypothetical protein
MMIGTSTPPDRDKEEAMQFYKQMHQFYCGIDLHARSMYVCIINQEGNILAHKNLPTDPEPFLKLIDPYQEDIVVGVECVFLWYWLADLCADEGIPVIKASFILFRDIYCLVYSLKTLIKTLNTFPYIPGDFDSRDPAMFKTPGSTLLNQDVIT